MASESEPTPQKPSDAAGEDRFYTPRASLDMSVPMRRATYAAVGVALVLIGVKIVGWRMTGSLAMLSTLVDSALDLLASLVNLVAVHQATMPATRRYRFGLGKAEALAGLGQAVVIIASAVFIIVTAVLSFDTPAAVQSSNVGIAIIAFSIVVTVVLVAYQRRVVVKTKSLAISADSLHYKGDILMNGSVIMALIFVTYLDFNLADSIFAFGIGLYLLWGARHIGVEAVVTLMDREISDENRARIQELVMAHPEVLSMHDLRTRSSGVYHFIQFHIELVQSLELTHAHDICDDVEEAVARAFPGAEIIIHADPEGVMERRAIFR